MGMTQDFPIGIEEGATLVRVGTAIFGERSKRKRRKHRSNTQIITDLQMLKPSTVVRVSSL